MHTSHNLILKFYDSFSKLDADNMISCYHPKVTFKDPAFGNLNYQEVCTMWRMLIEKSNGNLTIEFSNIKVTKKSGKAKWIATYTFSQTNRKVKNIIQAKFKFKDGLIISHNDSFNFWFWSGMALGWKGYLLGWTPFFRNKVRQQANLSLKKYMTKN
ncbi:nuclear transport factor 2 family protein [Flavobacterium piscinae]|uniref:Nuclear transport factor 2 family protein n=1 Tax=Flavobacterium piscinae TaxID=2506424 RepID=A0A4Q1KSQ1_9FLAO|nr:nuclear transport factor 2 family protein [Flavobacterium piscinae]MBC8883124.1 nuclear transport factor 2 family protein [Flavobacterium piscinae]RXR33002.1 nuclear transport factor 2 family protein [Flavobacterium piscinae]